MEGDYGTFPNKVIMRYREVHLAVRSIEETRTFYHNVLGLPIIEESNDLIGFQLHTSKLFFHHQPGDMPVYHLAFNIPYQQVSAAVQWLAERTERIPLESGGYIADFVNWKAKAVYFFDNSGNILECIGREDLTISPEEIFSGQSFYSVSEFGVVTSDVPITCSWINEKFGTPVFFRQPPLPGFAAMGDDEGLMIVVSENRNWYPTQIASSRHWFRLVFEEGGKNFELEYEDLIKGTSP
jgi:catechol 2,3-dioxygenase-like lactoylglutathione lyase family enzyme